jgi:anti-sigma factor RsiW
MSATDDDRIARISGWLSGELDPAAARAVDREVRRDPAAQRIAAGFRRVDALAREWYDAVPVEPVVRPTVAVFRPPRAARVGGPLVAALAASLLVAAWMPAGSAGAFERLVDGVHARILAADDDAAAPRFERSAYWTLRPLATAWALQPLGGDRKPPTAP